MLPYVVIFIVCIGVNDIAKFTQQKYFVLISCLILSFFAGFRDLGVGIDTNTYTMSYYQVARSLTMNKFLYWGQIMSPGYLIVNWIGCQFANNYWGGLFMTELLICTFSFLGFYRLSQHYKSNLTIFTILFLFFFYNASFNFMRQMCAITIIFYSFSYLVERRFLWCAVWIMIAFLFHPSVIFALLLPLIYYASNINNRNTRYFTMFCIILLLLLAFVMFYQLLEYASYSGIISEEYGERYGDSGRYEGKERISYISFLISLFIYLVMGISYKDKIITNKTLAFHFMLNTVYLMCQFLILYSKFLFRLSYYFLFVSMFFLCVELSSSKTRYVVRYVTIIFFAICWFVWYMIKNRSGTYPFTSNFLEIY